MAEPEPTYPTYTPEDTNGIPAGNPPENFRHAGQALGDPVNGNPNNPPDEQSHIMLSTMSSSSLFAGLFTDGREIRTPERPEGEILVYYFKVWGLMAPPDFMVISPANLPEDPSIPSPRSEMGGLPLFDVDPLSPTAEFEPHIHDFPSPPPPPSPPHEAIDQEHQIQEEMQQQFQWFSDMLIENKKRGWGTAYRDFVDVLLLLKAVEGLGIVEQTNNRLTSGVFCASTGEFMLGWTDFIDAMSLEHSSATWRNKMTMYFRIKSLYLYFQHTGSRHFQDQAHDHAWEILEIWMENRDRVLGDSWATKRFGNTELRRLLQSMIQEAYNGKSLWSLHLFPGISDTDRRCVNKVAWSIWENLVRDAGDVCVGA